MVYLGYKPLLGGEKVQLRSFQETDLPFIKKCLTDPEVLKLTGSDMDFNWEEEKDIIFEWYQTRHLETDRLDLAIIDKKQGICVGETVVNLYDETNHSMNYRMLIGPEGRNRGLGTEATHLIVDYIFANTTLQQLTLDVLDFNPRARHVYEKVGFVKNGVHENELQFEGEWIDAIQMCLTREDWVRRSNVSYL